MGLRLAIVVLLLTSALIVGVLSSSQWSPSLPELGYGSPRADGSFAHSVLHDFGDSKFFRLEYNATMNKKYQNTELWEGLGQITCTESRKRGGFQVKVDFLAAAHMKKAQVFNGAIFSIHKRWKCGKSLTGMTSTFHEVVEFSVSRGTSLRLVTRPVSLADVFQHAKVSLRTNAFPAHDSKSIIHPSPGKNAITRKRDIVSFFEELWSLVQDFMDVVEDVIKVIWEASKILENGGNYGPSNYTSLLKSVGWNYDSDAQFAKEPIVLYDQDDFTINCTNCYVFLDVDFVFELDIQDYTLINTAAYLEGNAGVNIETVFTFAYAWSDSWTTNLDPIYLPAIAFAIGPVPFEAQITIPVEIDVQFDISAQATYDVGVFATGSLQFGLNYTNSGCTDNCFKMITSHSFNQGGGANGMAAVESTFQVTIFPTVLLQIDYVGGPYLSMKPYLEVGCLPVVSNLCFFDSNR